MALGVPARTALVIGIATLALADATSAAAAWSSPGALPARGPAESFAAGAAKVFTLDPDGSVGAIVAVPGGDVVYAVRGRHDVPGRLMRMTPEGVRQQVRCNLAQPRETIRRRKFPKR